MSMGRVGFASPPFTVPSMGRVKGIGPAMVLERAWDLNFEEE